MRLLQGKCGWTVIAHCRLWCSEVESLLSPQQAIALTWSRYNTQKNLWWSAGGFWHQSRRTQNLCLCMHSKTPQLLGSVCSHKHLLFIYVHLHAPSVQVLSVWMPVFACWRDCVKTAPTKLCVSKPGYLDLWKCDICCYRDVFYHQK